MITPPTEPPAPPAAPCWWLGANPPSSATAGVLPNLRAHMPELDGLRAVAALMIVAVHWLFFAPTGTLPLDAMIYGVRFLWVGVDLFFVLSGFLITGILIDSRGRPGYFGGFFLRRALRILPLYYGVLAVYFWVIPLTELFSSGRALWLARGSTLWYWLFLSNISEGMGLTRHMHLVLTWSLSVEENFYLVWPLIVARFGTRGVLRICAGLFVFSFGMRCVLLHGLNSQPYMVSMLTPTRLDGLALGGLLAALLRVQPDMAPKLFRWAFRGLIPLTLAFIGFAWLQETTTVVDGQYMGPNRYIITVGLATVSVYFAALMIAGLMGGAGSMLSRVLRWNPLVAVGKLSFSIYLLHELVLDLVVLMLRPWLDLPDYQWTNHWPVALAAAFAVQMGLSTLLWRFFEEPLIQWSRRQSRRLMGTPRPDAA